MTDEEFRLIFPARQDVTFVYEVMARGPGSAWARGFPKHQAMGIRGLLFGGLPGNAQCHPTRRDEEAADSGGSRLR
jgi:hypothetical protein